MSPIFNQNAVVKYFNTRAQVYSDLSARWPWSWIRGRESNSIRSLISISKGSSVLEIGAGSGQYASQMINWGATNVYANDLSAEMLACLPDRDEITGIVGDAANIDLGFTFDHCLAAGVLEFVESPGEVISNITNHLNVNGNIVVLVPKRNILGHLYKLYHLSHGVSVSLFSRRDLESIASDCKLVISRYQFVWPFSSIFRLEKVGF